MSAVKPARVVGAVCALGLVLTVLAAGAAARVDRASERRLLEGQTKQAALVLTTAIYAIRQPLTGTVDALRATPAQGDEAAFERLFSGQVGDDTQFVSASLWQREGRGFTRISGLGVAPGLPGQGQQMRDLLERALSSDTEVIQRVDVGDRSRIAYALADAESGTVLYAERAIPADRQSRVANDSAFADLDYAIYLGPGTATADLTTTSVDPADLPLDGLTDQATVPFGDTELTFVTSPRRHLGSSLGQWLPLVLLLGGLVLTAISALVVLKLVRSRLRAEEDTETITTLYQTVDSLYGEQRELFVRLQRALLPPSTPDLGGIEVGATYVAGAQGIDIGGDWYSVIGIGDDRFAFVVGDVSGNGIDAVAEMARARFTLRAYLLDGNEPHVALAKCSAQFDVAKDEHIVTALVGIGNRETGEIVLANAGHPPPLLASPSGADFVSIPVGRPLGAGPFTAGSATFTMPAGSTLLCYTDGLIERRTEDIDSGMRRLARAVAPVVTQPLDELIRAVILAMRDDTSADDIAVLALRRVDSRTRLTADQHAPARARDFVRLQLNGAALPDGVPVEDVVLVTSELVTNAVRAGAKHVDLEVDVTDDGVDLAVEDDGEGWPQMQEAAAEDTGGRGLSIVDQLSDSWTTTAVGAGKRVSVTWSQPARTTPS